MATTYKMNSTILDEFNVQYDRFKKLKAKSENDDLNELKPFVK